MADLNPAANLLLMLGEWENIETLVQRSIGGNVRLLDERGNMVVGKETLPPLCGLIQGTEIGLSRCQENYAKFCTAPKSAADESKIFCCHAGLSNFCLPITFEGKFLGALIGGATFAEKKDLELALNLLSELHLDTEKNKEKTKEITQISNSELRGIVRVIQNVALPFVGNLLRQEHQIQLEQRLHSQIYNNSTEYVVDKISGVFSPAYLTQRMEQEIARANRYNESLSFLVVEIENLADINQTQGYQAGDVVLQETAKLLQNNARRSETVARLSGNRFGVIFPYTRQEAASSPIQRLRQTLGDYNYMVGHIELAPKIEIKMGLVEYLPGGSGAQELLAGAIANLK